MQLSKVRFAAVALLFALVFAGIGAGVALATQSHMLSARTHLNAGLNELEVATPDKAGHRANAIKLVNQAIYQVNLGIKAGM
jgi:hypothetical protein